MSAVACGLRPQPLSAAEFIALLDAAPDRESLANLLALVPRIQCPFRQRQALLARVTSRLLQCSGAPMTAAPTPQLSVECSPPPNSYLQTPISLRVQPVEHERGRYWVQSRTNGGIPYLVDLEEFNGNGWCGCKGFLHYIESLELGAAPSPDLQCRHIKAVREFLRAS
jgi:hypothetical protein